jgi:hypothetical protein
VILTDCCSDAIGARDAIPKLPKKQKDYGSPNSVEPGYEQLFFRTKGVVDITAADDGKLASGHVVNGGVFTCSFRDAIIKEVNNGKLTWNDFYGKLKDQVAETRKNWHFEPQTSRAFGLPGTTWGFLVSKPDASSPKLGLHVSEIHLESAAERGGLQSNDTIIGVDGHQVRDLDDLISAMERHKAGAPLRLEIRRDDNPMTITITPN